MKQLDTNELCNVKGGFTVTPWLVLGISAAIVFLSGVIEGITNPDRCNS